MTHLRAFEIRSFRNVRPAKLECRPGLNVVLGKNAAGKTTLLDLLAKCLSPFRTESEDRRDALDVRDIAFVLENSDAKLERHVLQERVSFLEAAVGTSPSETFELRVGDLPPLLKVRAAGGWLSIDGKGQVRAERSPYASLVQHLRSTDPKTAELLLDFSEPNALRLDESLEYLNALLSFEATKRGGAVTSNLDIGQPSGLRELLRSPFRIDDSGFRAPLEFASRAARTMGYDEVEAHFDVESKTTSGGTETTVQNLRFIFKYLSDTFAHTSLSYGEKRLLAFFALSDATKHIMIVDELVNGLHHEWIKACLDEIGTRQAFLTSQNPLLLDYLEFESAEDVQRGFVLCERIRSADKAFAELIWRNPTQAEAAEFFAAYETGVQRVSDILISKGFW